MRSRTRYVVAGDLKQKDIKPAYRHYFDQAFSKIGGAAALDRIGNPDVASAVADTLFRSGPGKGTEMVQDAANASGADIAKDNAFGSRTLDALKDIAGSDERTRIFLDGLADRRETGGFEREKPRFGQFRRR
ncbi:MAG: hypothetical protein GC202_12205 [Alphaproteobacteria bacterium]|nr:hypothetical protein [Alphaproteobacteria bacterium]